jgi:hypothetical protein
MQLKKKAAAKANSQPIGSVHVTDMASYNGYYGCAYYPKFGSWPSLIKMSF